MLQGVYKPTSSAPDSQNLRQAVLVILLSTVHSDYSSKQQIPCWFRLKLQIMAIGVVALLTLI